MSVKLEIGDKLIKKKKKNFLLVYRITNESRRSEPTRSKIWSSLDIEPLARNYESIRDVTQQV